MRAPTVAVAKEDAVRVAVAAQLHVERVRTVQVLE